MASRFVRLWGVLLLLCLGCWFSSAGFSVLERGPLAALASPVGPPTVSSSPIVPLASPWITETVVPVLDGPHRGAWSLALDSAGQPHIAYCDETGAELRHAWRDSSSWHFETVAAQGCRDVALAIDLGGQLDIAYDSTTGLVYLWFDGTGWYTNTVGPGAAEPPVLALDAAGYPHIAYVYLNSSSGYAELRYARYDGAAWLTQVVETTYSFNSGYGIHGLALDATGAHLSWAHMYRFGGDMQYAYYDGQGWQYLRRTPAGLYAALALDTAGQPQISYCPLAFPEALRYTYRTDQGWLDELVDSAGVSVQYVSLALDQADYRHIAYAVYHSNDIRYAFYDGSTWFIEQVDNGLGADYTVRLALEAAGSPHLAYVDSGGRLKHAYRQCVGLQRVTISGAASWPIGLETSYTATYTPPTATLPIMAWNNGAVGFTAPYQWEITGTHTIIVTATNACAQAQDSFTVTTFCQQLNGVDINGPRTLTPGLLGTYEVSPQPITASAPLTFTWSSGLAGSTAHYSWSVTGTYTLTVTGTNVCGGTASTRLQVQVVTEWPYVAYLPVAQRGE